MASPSSLYSSLFDGIICITLADAKDRHAHMRHIIKQTHIPLEFYYAKRHPLGGRVGCFDSHVAVVKLAYERGYKNVLVLEDDLLPTSSYDPRIIAKAMEVTRPNKDPEWEMIKFGYVPMRDVDDIFGALFYLTSPEVSPYVVRYQALAAQAYTLSRKAMRKIVEHAPSILASATPNTIPHYDIWLQSIIAKRHAYCTIPQMFDQKWCMPTYNIAESTLEKVVFRPNQCLLESWQICHRLSLMRHYRNLAVAALLTTALAMYIALKR